MEKVNGYVYAVYSGQDEVAVQLQKYTVKEGRVNIPLMMSWNHSTDIYEDIRFHTPIELRFGTVKYYKTNEYDSAKAWAEKTLKEEIEEATKKFNSIQREVIETEF
jgi:hypothetical protein